MLTNKKYFFCFKKQGGTKGQKRLWYASTNSYLCVILGYLIVSSADVKQKCRIKGGIGLISAPEENGWE